MSENESIIILFDSECPQCSWFIQKLCSFPQNQDLKFASLYGETALNLYKSAQLTSDPRTLDSMVVLLNGLSLTHWDALIYCLKRIPALKLFASFASHFPTPLGNFIYEILVLLRNIVRKRKKQGCSISSCNPKQFLP